MKKQWMSSALRRAAAAVLSAAMAWGMDSRFQCLG